MSSRKISRMVSLAVSLGIIFCSSANTVEAKKESKSSEKNRSSSANISNTQNDTASLQGQIGALSKAIADGNAKAAASIWTEDGNYIDVDGSESKGRGVLEKRFAELAAVNGKKQIELLPGKPRFLGGNVAVIEGTVRRNNGIDGPEPETRFSMVFVKQNGNWLIAQATESPFLSAERSDPLKQLSWIIGDWNAEKSGASVHMKADWAANRNFIVCHYEVKKSADSPVLESKQIIGWDPRSEQPLSWHFDSNGGFGYGNWVKKDKEWMVDATGVDRDGSTTSATNILSLTAPDSFSWQSVNRSVNGVDFDDTAPVTVHRVIK